MITSYSVTAVTGIVTGGRSIPRAVLSEPVLGSVAAPRRVAQDVVERAPDGAGAALDAVAEADQVLALLFVPLVHAGRTEVVAVLARAPRGAHRLVGDLD